MGMYDLGHYPPDSFLWEFIAYCAGTGGSILIIGSAAGVAAMGLERIEFLWYARRIAVPALVGLSRGRRGLRRPACGAALTGAARDSKLTPG